MDAGFLIERAECLVFDLVERLLGAGHVPAQVAEHPGYLPYAVPWRQRQQVPPAPYDRIVVHDCLECEHVVGVDPEGDLFVLGPTLKLGRGDASELAGDRVEPGAVRLESSVVDPGIDDVSTQDLRVGAVSLVE